MWSVGQEATVSVEIGLYGLAVVGEYRLADGAQRSFVVRSLPIVSGAIGDDISVLF